MVVDEDYTIAGGGPTTGVASGIVGGINLGLPLSVLAIWLNMGVCCYFCCTELNLWYMSLMPSYGSLGASIWFRGPCNNSFKLLFLFLYLCMEVSLFDITLSLQETGY